MRLTDPDATIYVAGHRGMVGRALWRHLEDAGYTNLVGRPSDEFDLRDPAATRQVFEAEQPDVVVLSDDSFVGAFRSGTVWMFRPVGQQIVERRWDTPRRSPDGKETAAGTDA